MVKPTLVINIRPSGQEAVKPSELIQITGHHALGLASRRMITILWHNAHKQGIEEGKDYIIPLSDLRSDGHHGSEQIRETIRALMTTLIEVRNQQGNVETTVQILGGNDMFKKDRAEGTLTYSFDKRLIWILKDSAIWGKISMPVLMSFSTKYAVSLYENVAQLFNLDFKHTETFTIQEFRWMLGVEENKYSSFGELNKHVLKRAVDEVSALAPFNIQIQPVKTGKKVTHLIMGWWEKSEDELKAAYREIARPKVGRRARIEGTTEHLVPSTRIEDQLRKERVIHKRLPKTS